MRIFVRVHNHFYIYYLLMSYCLIVLIGTCNPNCISVLVLRQSSIYCLNACLIAVGVHIPMSRASIKYPRYSLLTEFTTRRTKTPTEVGVVILILVVKNINHFSHLSLSQSKLFYNFLSLFLCSSLADCNLSSNKLVRLWISSKFGLGEVSSFG